jgi:hypothetical protein
MTFTKTTIALCLGVASSLALAGGFDGPFLQVGVGFSNAQTQAISHWPDTNIDATLTENNFVGQFGGGYSKSWGQFFLAASAYYVIDDQKSGGADLSSLQYGTNTYEFKNTNTLGVSIDPSVNLNDSTTAHLKLGYGRTAGKGRVLVVGGMFSRTSAELYDPATGTWSTVGELTYARSYQTATLLNGGMVLAAGGDADLGVRASAELFYPGN